MRQIYAWVMVLCLIPWQAFGTAYTASVSGDWNNPATYGNSGPPLAADTVTINKGVRVNVFGNVSSAGITVGANAGAGSGLAFLNMSTGAKLTMTGALTVGNGTTADGGLIYGKSTRLNLNGANLVLGNGTQTSTTTSTQWAVVAGTGAIATHAVVTAPKQVINLQYVSFQNTGNKVFALADTTGATASSLSIRDSAFPSAGTIQFGTGGTGATTNHTVTNVDFRETGNITVSGSSGAGVINYSNNRFAYTSSNAQRVFACGKQNTDLRGSVFYGFKMDSTSLGYFNLTNTFFGVPESFTTTSASVLSLGGSTLPHLNTHDNIYIYTPYTSENPHPFGVLTAAGQTTNVTNMIIEMHNTESSDGGNAYLIGGGTGTSSFTNNLLIGTGTMFTVVGAKTQNIIATNNTQVVTETSAYGRPHALFFAENGETSGTVTLKNNLSHLVGGTGSYFAADNTGTKQVITLSDYNAWWNVGTAAYGNVTVSAGQTHDVTLSASPNFADATRSLSTWKGSAATSIAQLLAIGGYNSTSKTQSDAPSGVTVSQLLTWVRAGFAPKNTAELLTAGEGGTYIGAVQPQANTATPKTVRGFAAFNLGFSF